jgi:Uma2 family endonuclease
MSVPLRRYHFNVAEFYRMADAGILTPDDHVELIEGEIIEMSPTGSRHAACVDRIVNKVLSRFIGHGAIVRVQSPIALDDFSEPQPDAALLRARADFYSQAHPTPDDVLLLVEVSDTTAAYDKRVKVPLYARSGIAEVWVVDLTREVIEVYARPAGGSYRQFAEVKRGESVTSATVAGLTLPAEDIVG